MSARPDDLGAGFDLAFAEERDSLALSTVDCAPSISTVDSTDSDSALSWSLPGHGEPTETCGRWNYRGHVGKSGPHYQAYLRRCGSASCPVCATEPGGWASREASAITDRVNAGRPRGMISIHVIVGPAPEMWPEIRTERGYRSLRREAYRKARAHGLLGGAWVFHHARVPGRWKETKDGRPNVRDRCADGPHWHVIGYGWITPSHPETERWVVWNLGVRRSVRGTAFYALTHAGLGARVTDGTSPMPDLSHSRRPVETVTWSGILSYRTLKAPRVEPGSVKCPVCGEEVPRKEWYRLVWRGSGPPPTGAGVCRPGEWSAYTLDYTGWGRGERIEIEV